MLQLLICVMQVARRHFLSTTSLDAMLELRKQFAQLLAESHLIPHHQQPSAPGSSSSSRGGGSKWACWADDPTHPCNRFSQAPEVLKAALVAALSPHVATSLSTAAGTHSKPGWLDNRGQQVRVCVYVTFVEV
jgi:ATP-dependent RNA helicase DHX29